MVITILWKSIMPNKLVTFYSRKLRKPNGEYDAIGGLASFVGWLGWAEFMDEQGRIPRWRAEELVND